MAQQYREISDRLAEFIVAQHVFFVATAAREGRVNVSPKGLDALRVVGPNRVVWLNGTGSGNETAAHLLDVNRMTLMFCSFERQPLILRLYGTATEIQPGQPEWDERIGFFPPMPGARQIFDMRVDQVQTSCGYGVPFMEYADDRPLMAQWAEKKGPDGLEAYQREKNLTSIDGFPTGLRVPGALHAPASSATPAMMHCGSVQRATEPNVLQSLPGPTTRQLATAKATARRVVARDARWPSSRQASPEGIFPIVRRLSEDDRNWPTAPASGLASD